MIMGAWGLGRKPKLPYDAEVEYLESTGTQWIDTGVVPSLSDVVSIRYNRTVANMSIFGCTGNSFRMNAFAIYMGQLWYGTSYPAILPNVVGSWVSLKVDGANLVATVNGMDNALTAQTSEPFKSMFVFAMNASNKYPCSAKISEFSISRNGVKLIDYQPVRFTNELGQSEGATYDRVSCQLFRNQGTGSFVLGPDK